ncbi:MAG: hypothetical protein GXO87_10995 [Chlorobi bacterium]|nr:hypothetical protein [Chlorobiota bacterium]
MLEKIKSINRNKPYKGRKRTSNFERYFSKPYTENLTGNDSIVFSPAAIYLSRIKWHMEDIEYLPGDKVKLDFFIDDIEFKTVVEIQTFPKTNRLNFELIKREFAGHKMKKLIAKVNVAKKHLKVCERLPEIELNGVKEAFRRVQQLKLQTELKQSDSFALNDILDGIAGKVYREFDEILNRLYTFLDKIGKYKLPKELEFERENIHDVIIEEISALYG